MPTKTPVKMTARKNPRTKSPRAVSQKTSKNPSQKITLDDLLKSQNEAWAAIRETQKNIGGVNKTLCSIAEHMLTPGLPRKFKKIGYSFNRIASYKLNSEGGNAKLKARCPSYIVVV